MNELATHGNVRTAICKDDRRASAGGWGQREGYLADIPRFQTAGELGSFALASRNFDA
jgi:hypothetical protein